MPRMNLASSDIRSGVHGGSHVSSISTSSTPGTSPATRLMSSWIIGPAGQPIEVRLCDHLDVRPLDLDVVEQAELDDVHPELGILDLAQRLERLPLCVGIVHSSLS